jgi:transposase
MKPGPWTPPPPEVQLLQALSRRLHGLIKMRRQELNRQEAECEKVVKRSIAVVVKTIEAEMEKVRKKIKELLAVHEELRRKHQLLLSIPAVGEETAHLILAEVPNLVLFTEAKQLVAFAGLASREIRSGTSVRGRTSLSKTGNSRLRRGLYMSAVVAMKWNPIVAAFSNRLLEIGKPPMKVVVAAMRKLLHIIFGVLKSGKPFSPKFGLT